MDSGISIRHLSFCGPSKPQVHLSFEEGLNVVYGASNTGKSFTLKALNFMFGGSKSLPGIEQRDGYDAILLGLVLPDGSEITLYRATQGGAFALYDGLHLEKPSISSRKLNEKHDLKSSDNISVFLLSALGLDGKFVARNSNGDKDSLSFRYLAPYLFVDEKSIIDEQSPILSGQFSKGTVERNVFKVILTGVDDTSVVSVEKPKVAKATALGKVELIDEMVAVIDLRLASDDSALSLSEDARLIDEALANFDGALRDRQDELDALVKHRRDLSTVDADLTARLSELELTIVRFQKLDEVYRSDLARLESLEEGSYLLLSRVGRACPVCGAAPNDQRHAQSVDEIRRAHQATEFEVVKISRDLRDLRTTIESLTAESGGLRGRQNSISKDLSELEVDINRLIPLEAQHRSRYEKTIGDREAVQRKLDLLDQRAALLSRRKEIGAKTPMGSNTVVPGIDGATAHAFAMTVQKVLEEWNFPGSPKVSFDLEMQDLRINGKERSANGKGVRALLHAAFKVSVLIFCRERGLPHPGFVVLDTPLLTYREPLESPKYGDLSPDELEIKKSSLNEFFYRHLRGLGEVGQIIVLENADPPPSASDAHTDVFTGQSGQGRFGLFPSI